MKTKKQTAMILAAVIALSCGMAPAPHISAADITSVSTAAGGQTAETKALQNAVADVKKRVDIPASLTEFSKETNNKYGVSYYTFKWYREEERKNNSGGKYKVTVESITVRYYRGNITGYEYYNEDRSGSGKRRFAKLTAAEQQKAAEENLKKLMPDLKGHAVFERSTFSSSLNAQNVTFIIKRVENDIPVKNNSGSMTIDRDTGKLISFRLKWWNDADIPKPENILSEEQVSEIYEKRKGLKAYYNIYTMRYDEETGEYVNDVFALPVYVPVNQGENEIDAFTGKYTSKYVDMKKYSQTDAYDWDSYDDDMVEEEYEEEEEEEDSGYVNAGAGYGGYKFTDAEMKAFDEENTYITYEKALKIIKDDPYIILNDNMISSRKTVIDLPDDCGNPRKAWKLDFEYTTNKPTEDYISLTVYMDALTGEIIRFSKTYGYGKESANKDNSALDHNNALAVAKRAGEHFLGDRYKEYRYSDSSETYKYDNTPAQQTIYFTRYVNGLEVPQDKLIISVDSHSEVLNFSYTYHDIKFPEAKLVSKQAAYDRLFEDMKPTLSYEGFADLQLKPHIYLTYTFDSDFMLNALTGERIGYLGTSYYADKNPKTEKKDVKYSDIKGYKYEKEINTLLDNGIYITDSDRLCPEEDITVGEFLDLLNVGFGKKMYHLYTGKNEKETADMRSRRLTRSELLKIYVKMYSGDWQAAEMKGIFKQFYTDIPETSELCGYAAIGRYSGYITTRSGKFDPDGGIKKGDALKALYDYLLQDKERNVYEVIKL